MLPRKGQRIRSLSCAVRWRATSRTSVGLRKASRPRWLKGPLRHGGRIPASASPPRPVSAECVGLFMPSGLAVEDSPSPWSYDPSCGLLSTESPQACYRLGCFLAGFSGAGGSFLARQHLGRLAAQLRAWPAAGPLCLWGLHRFMRSSPRPSAEDHTPLPGVPRRRSPWRSVSVRVRSTFYSGRLSRQRPEPLW